MTTVDEVAAATDRRPNALVRLYRGETSFDFVGHRRWWYALSAIVIVAGLVSMGTRGFNWGIDFKGGTSWQVASHGASVTEVENAVKAAGVSGATVEVLGGRTVNVEADLTKLPAAQQATIKAAVATALGRIGHVPAPQVSVTDVGATWGSQISQKAIIAVLVFFIVVVVYITFRFEWKMAIAALLAVIHDLLVTAGIYSLAGFQVTPDTVIAVLTILGYSLYDTVVVFDRVGENTKGLGASGRMTYEDVVNLSMNQTLARSINTSLVAILPVLSVLVIGAQILGATTLQYFGLALVIGLTSGAYSSIFIASPVLASMKEREPRYINIRQKLANRSDRTGVLTPRAAAALTVASGPAVGARAVTGSRARGGRAAAGAARAAPTAQRPPGVLRPGAATRAAAEPEPAGPDGPLEATGNGARGPAKRPPGGGVGAAGPRRPPPRPRKGKGKKGGKRR